MKLKRDISELANTRKALQDFDTLDRTSPPSHAWNGLWAGADGWCPGSSRETTATATEGACRRCEGFGDKLFEEAGNGMLGEREEGEDSVRVWTVYDSTLTCIPKD